MSKKVKSSISINIEYFFFRMMTGLIRILPLKAAYAAANVMSGIVFALDFKHAGRAVTHVLHSGIRTDRKSAKKLARESFRHMFKVFIEIVKFDQFVNEKNFYEHITAAKDPTSQKMMNKDTTCQIILATAHLGNWELAGGTHSHMTGIPMTSIMRPLANYKIGEYFYKKRSSFQHETISKDLGLRPFLKAHKEGHNITIVADQHASRREGVEVTFFGHPARAHATPALLHLRTGTPIAMPYLIRKDNNFNFEFHCTEPLVYTPTGDKEADVKAICQLYTSMIEEQVRKFPEQWLWAHRRWLDSGRGKYPPEDTEDTEDTEKNKKEGGK